MSLFPTLDPSDERGAPSRQNPLDDASPGARPLADRMRPRTLDECVGQEALLGPGGPLRTQIERDDIGSMILWGPPGCGKTTIARIIARVTRSEFISFSAVLTGIKEIKEVMAEAERGSRSGRRTIVFIDEVHRFNKSQQDAFLPHVEAGNIILIGATTENPTFEVISPLLSRTRVYVLQALSDAQILTLLQRALTDSERGLGNENVSAENEALQRIATMANGDARAAYNTLEAVVRSATPDKESRRTLTVALLGQTLQRKFLAYDKSGEEHYNLISALHKSVRNSDADATLYWLVRMLESGEDPLYVARRLVRMASEDIGLAEPNAVAVAIAAMQAADFVGPPEGNLALAQAAVYLALAPKSNALYLGYGQASKDLQETRAEPVPLHLRNAVTGLMKNVGYGRGYQYAHDYDEKVADMSCLPESLAGRNYYAPTDQGFEKRLRQRLEEIRNLKVTSAKAGASHKTAKP
jgi:putative ATPase